MIFREIKLIEKGFSFIQLKKILYLMDKIKIKVVV